jgi:phospholipid/cholesterol/gamma-HCH transport system substrate-binding protein
MISTRWLVGGVAAAVVSGLLLVQSGDEYEVQFVMPSAAQLSKNAPVWIDGQRVGEVSDLGLKDGKALVTVSIEDDAAPLHAGTTTRVEWVSAIGERVLTVVPGPDSNAEIPEGAYVEAVSHQAEVDQILAALDAKTRKRLSSLIGRLQKTVDGREPQVRDTIVQAAGTVDAMGEVLRAVGEDGPAIRAIVQDLTALLDASADRRSQIADSVTNLSDVANAVADEHAALGKLLEQLPATMDTASTTLDKVPSASEETVGLLDELEPSTDRLQRVSKNLAPVLVDLRPTVAELRPLVRSADELLGRTPALLDSSHAVLPDVTGMLSDLSPAIAFLRPYTPELIGWIQNWGQGFAPYDGAGHTWAALVAPGTNAVNESLVPLPTARQNPEPHPGQAEGRPWTDATGSEVR